METTKTEKVISRTIDGTVILSVYKYENIYEEKKSESVKLYTLSLHQRDEFRSLVFSGGKNKVLELLETIKTFVEKS